MKMLITIFFIFLIIEINAQDSLYNKVEQRCGGLLNKLKSKKIEVNEKNELRTYAFGFQNYGQLLEENNHDYIKSLTYIDKAITLCIVLKDT